jgi:DNA-binding MarR family transcriptional regulator
MTSTGPAASQLPLDRRFGYRFHMISRALGQQMLVHVGREYGLNLAEYRIITVLANRKSPSIKDIAAHTDLDKAHVTRALASLAERGFASQKIDAQDRRLREVKLTAAGWAVVNTLDRYVIVRQKRLEQGLTKSELTILWKAIGVLAEESSKMLAEEQGGAMSATAGSQSKGKR